MSNPGSRSNDDKLLAKIKDLEAKVEDLKRHTHPDRSWGKPGPSSTSAFYAEPNEPSTIADDTESAVETSVVIASTGLLLVASSDGLAVTGPCIVVVSGWAQWNTAGAWDRRLMVSQNGTSQLATSPPHAHQYSNVSYSGYWQPSFGTIELAAWQNSGFAEDVQFAGLGAIGVPI